MKRNMNTIAVDRKQTAFRLRTDLLDRLKVAAMKDAKENGNLETLDLIFMIFSDTNDANK